MRLFTFEERWAAIQHYKIIQKKFEISSLLLQVQIA